MHLNVLIYSSTTLSKEEQKTILQNANEIIFILALSSSRKRRKNCFMQGAKYIVKSTHAVSRTDIKTSGSFVGKGSK